MKTIERNFLGRGWSFPPAFNKSMRRVEMLEAEEDIRSSLEVLLSTRLGERIMQPRYGCNLDEMVFESLSTTFKTYLTELIRSAILIHEPRIDLESVEFENDGELEGVVLIVINFTVRTTNSRMNFVFPFYKNEATNL